MGAQGILEAHSQAAGLMEKIKASRYFSKEVLQLSGQR